MVTLKIQLDEQVNYEIMPNIFRVLTIEMSPQRAMELWQELETYLEDEGMIWDDAEH